jgi:hypothetical protein
VRKIAETEFHSRSDEFLSARVASELVVAPLEIHEEQIEVSTRDAKVDISHDFRRSVDPWGPSHVDGLEVTYHLPFVGDPNLWKCRPSTFTLNGAHAVIEARELRFPYESADRDVQATKKSFTDDLSKVKQWLGWVNEQVAEYNGTLEPAARGAVSQRRAELGRTKADVEALGFKVRDTGLSAPSQSMEPSARLARRTARREKARRKYDVALSFAGEDRTYVEAVANELSRMGVSVFYDGFEQVNLWGKDLAEHLGHVYGEDARFTVIFASRHYAAKAWPSHEKSFALSRHLRGETGRILPVKFDATEIPGVPATLGYLDLRALTPEKLAELVRQKIDLDEVDA